MIESRNTKNATRIKVADVSRTRTMLEARFIALTTFLSALSPSVSWAVDDTVSNSTPKVPVVPPQKEWNISFRTGAAIPIGKESSQIGMNDVTGVAMPLWVDLTFQPAPWLDLGAYAIFTVLGESKPLTDATTLGVHTGLQAEFRFLPKRLEPVWPSPFVMEPWVGIGGGWEQANSMDDSWSFRRSGAEVLLQTGATLVQKGSFSLAPFLAATFSQYAVRTATRISSGEAANLSNADSLGTGTVTEPAIHSWFMLGIRGRVSL